MYFDLVIIGGGMVGLSVARNAIKRAGSRNYRVAIIEKEKQTGIHSSGRNSGVLHAGIYYVPNTLKAKVCIEGKNRLTSWVKKNGLKYNQCGKFVVAQEKELDPQLDVIAERGKKNGAALEIISEKELAERLPEARTASNRAIWTPDTAVVDPKEVISTLSSEVIELGVSLICNQISLRLDPELQRVKLVDGIELKYGHLINCAGSHSLEVAQFFDIGQEYIAMPFKGLYWKIRQDSKVKFGTNLYPVPDLEVPFLGVHFTPNASKDGQLSIGPTATIALGRENYRGLDAIEPSIAINSVTQLVKQYITNSGNIRKYAHEQALLCFLPLMLKEAQKLVPALTLSDIEISEKVGIRAQLFNKELSKLENDFICITQGTSTHILNSISPAFTASFELGDLILDKANILASRHAK